MNKWNDSCHKKYKILLFLNSHFQTVIRRCNQQEKTVVRWNI